MIHNLLIAKNDKKEIYISSNMINRHGLITGATGTGKTATLRRLSEQFSDIGIPVFLADIKGDLTGMINPGDMNEKTKSRLETMHINDFNFQGYPVTFWDLYGQRGARIRSTISDMGPLLLSRVLELNDTQESILTLVFKIADEQNLLLNDIKDLRAMLQFVDEQSEVLSREYGNIATTSISTIARNLIVLEEQGADQFFGLPSILLNDLFAASNSTGPASISILEANRLIQSPKLYATFLLWLLSELFENLPEVGDLDQPKCVFFFDEAHLLFNDAPKALLNKIEQVIRLIRSKGVGVFFITQNPIDIPDTVLGQLGNRVQHALRSFTPRDQKAVKAAAQTFRQNPDIDIESEITQLGVGEALVSFLDEGGAPVMVERALILPPKSNFTPIDDTQLKTYIMASPMYNKYLTDQDNESAYERLQQSSLAAQSNDNSPEELNKETKKKSKSDNAVGDIFEAFAKSAARSIGTKTGNQIIRGIMGSIFK